MSLWGPPSGFQGSPYGVEDGGAEYFASPFPTHPPQTEALEKGPLHLNHNQSKISQMTILS